MHLFLNIFGVFLAFLILIVMYWLILNTMGIRKGSDLD